MITGPKRSGTSLIVTSTQFTTPPDAELSLAIGGMTCGACASRIQRRLNELDGVQASVNYASELASVVLRPDIPVHRLIEEIRSVGYDASVVPEPTDATEGVNDLDDRVHILGRRLLVAALLLMPLCDASLLFSLVPAVRFSGWQWLV
ncbi:MAG: heavy metal-associated domain-containing protein, partial [Acidimicrobiales bacterium]